MKKAMARWLALAVAALLWVGCATTRPTVPPKRDVSGLVELSGDAIIVRESIQFDLGSADIAPKSMDLLDAVAQIMKNTTAIKMLTVEGHTDPTGDPASNQPLSLLRAGAVLKYLEGRGVERSRMEARGFGADRPVDSNETEEGRAKNRRVVFKVTR
jgi:OOP family OmpA-OmpF porin